MCFGAALFSVVLYLPLYLQLGRGVGIGASGLLLLPVTLAQVVSAVVTGRLVTHTGHVNIFPLAGLTLATIAFLGLAATVAGAPTAVVTALTMLVGVGLGMVMPPTQVTVQLAAGRKALGVATATISLSRAIGGAAGVAVVGAVLFAADGPRRRRRGHAAAARDGGGRRLHRGDAGAAADGACRRRRRGLPGRVHRDGGVTALGAVIAATVPRTEWDDDDAGGRRRRRRAVARARDLRAARAGHVVRLAHVRADRGLQLHDDLVDRDGAAAAAVVTYPTE